MFERFTDRARRVVVLAQEEAREMHHDYIGTEHLLLALLAEEDGIAARVMSGLGMRLVAVREEVTERVGTGAAPGNAKRIPFTPRAKKSLELSLREALAMNHNYIGTEHILLGVAREGEGAGAQILLAHGGDVDRLRADVLRMLHVDPARETGRRRRGLRRGRAAGQDFPGPAEAAGDAEDDDLPATPAAETVLAEAARLAGAGRLGSHHLVLAALGDRGTAAAQVLAALGLDLEAASQALRGADVRGTADELPEDAGRRQLVLRPAADRLIIELADPAAVRLGQEALTALGGQAGADGDAGLIRGDMPEGAGLGRVWLAIRDSLDEIRQAGRAAGAGPGPAGEAGGPGTEDPPPAATAG
jgi:ATP-dependent Clp protease ATP-binding subunit ClpA